MTFRDVIISASLLTALSLFSCGKSGSGQEEVRGDDRDEISTTEETPGKVFKAETYIPGFRQELVDTPKVFPELNAKNGWWQEPDGKYTYSFSFQNISDRDVVIERVEFESEPSDSAIVSFWTGKMGPGALTLAVIKVAKPYPYGFRHITFHLKGQKTPEVHTMEVLEKMPVPED